MEQNSTFFDPVRGDSFDPEDEIPWICGSEDDDRNRLGSVRNPMGLYSHRYSEAVLMGAGGTSDSVALLRSCYDPEDR